VNKIPGDIATLIRTRRNALGLSQTELAQRINERAHVIQAYESCQAVRDNKVLRKLENVLGVRLIGQDKGTPTAAAAASRKV